MPVVDEAATRIREEVDEDANIIVGFTFDESLEDIVRVSVVATGIDNLGATRQTQAAHSLTELAGRLRNDSRRSAEQIERSATGREGAREPPVPCARAVPALPSKSIAAKTTTNFGSVMIALACIAALLC